MAFVAFKLRGMFGFQCGRFARAVAFHAGGAVGCAHLPVEDIVGYACMPFAGYGIEQADDNKNKNDKDDRVFHGVIVA